MLYCSTSGVNKHLSTIDVVQIALPSHEQNTPRDRIGAPNVGQGTTQKLHGTTRTNADVIKTNAEVRQGYYSCENLNQTVLGQRFKVN